MKTFSILTALVLTLQSSPLEYLNTLREGSGLIPLQNNTLLEKSATNHARYLDRYNEGGHQERTSKPFATGREINDRARYVGYKGGIIENVSTSLDDKSSIDDLFSAIYHRFAFLNLHIDEIGLASYYKRRNHPLKSYVYNMGNSKVRQLCEGKPYKGYGKIYSGVCSESGFTIKESDFLAAHYYFTKQNPEIVLFPYDGATEIPTTFFEESPDPLPHCKVSGYPVSIEFNPNAFDTNLSLLSFELFDDRYEVVEAKSILTQASDPNHRLSAYQFAFMPQEPLHFDTQYHAKVTYRVEDQEMVQTWSFRTDKSPYALLELNYNKQELLISNSEEFWLYIKPQDCNDVYRHIHSSYPKGLQIKHHFVNSNMLYFKITGKRGDKIKCRLDRGKEFTLIIG